MVTHKSSDANESLFMLMSLTGNLSSEDEVERRSWHDA